MRKKLTFYHALIVFVSLVLLVVTSCLALSFVNRKNYETQLHSYLTLTRDVLHLEEDESKEEQAAIKDTVNTLSSSEQGLRITIIDLQGNVIEDSDKSDITTSHLDREEIKNPGKIVYRYSTTLSKKMMYLAGKDNSNRYYIRVSIPLGNIYEILKVTILVSVITLIVVLILSIIIDIYVIDKSLKPLKEDTKRLSSIINSDYIETKDDDLVSISYQIDKTKDLIDNKIKSLTCEKEKLQFILNSMNQGLLIIDSEKNIQLFNNAIINIFKNKIKENDSLTSLTILPEIFDSYHDALNNNISSFDININNREYFINVSPIEEDWIPSSKDIKGVMMTFVDISEKKKLEDAKKDFFANASHELKSPLTSIIGYTEMIKNGFLSTPNEIKDAEERILSEAKRMNEIVKGMLDLSRLESEDYKKNIESLSLIGNIRMSLGLFEQEIESNKIDVEIHGEDFNVNMDKEDLSLLTKNLIENAVRYNRPSGKIVITLDKTQKICSIKDTGIGIPKTDVGRIFERFYRVDKARSRKLGGTGLGLSIVKHICLSYSIKISVDSILDIGSTFTLVF